MKAHYFKINSIAFICDLKICGLQITNKSKPRYRCGYTIFHISLPFIRWIRKGIGIISLQDWNTWATSKIKYFVYVLEETEELNY